MPRCCFALFATAYGSETGDPNWNELCDICGYLGDPDPDEKVNFDDLMVFATNFGKCAPPSAPILSGPGTNLPSPANYTVSWSVVTEATSYVLQEATSSDFTSGLQEYPLTDTSKDFSPTVSTTTTYYYRVAAINDCGQGGWSNVEDITVVIVTGPVHNLTKNIYYNTIQSALDDADSLGGDTIEVDDGTYEESIIFPAGKLVTLQGASGIRDNVIIRGANNLSTVTINGSSTDTTLSGFTITHTGGNTGSGISISSGNLIIDNCAISGNSTDYYGGGIFNEGTLNITSSTISDNSANHGGGIHTSGYLAITSSTISDNTATYSFDGGGIYNYTGHLVITGSTISGNTATSGGGIRNDDSTLTITSSDISGNNVSQQGGGIYLAGTGTITIGGNDASDTSNFNTFTDNKKDSIISADQHIRNSSGDCRSSYPYNYYNPN